MYYVYFDLKSEYILIINQDIMYIRILPIWYQKINNRKGHIRKIFDTLNLDYTGKILNPNNDGINFIVV